MMKNYILLLTTIFLSKFAQADIATLASEKVIDSLRGEGSVGLIAFAEASICGRRAYLRLNDDVERAKFSMAMMAFTSGKTVSIRVDDSEANKLYGACKTYDILVNK